MSETTGSPFCFIQHLHFLPYRLFVLCYHHLRDTFAIFNNKSLGREINQNDTNFSYGNLQLSSDVLSRNGELTVSVTVTNDGDFDGYEIVQMYLHDIYAEISRPVKELKGFERIFLKKG